MTRWPRPAVALLGLFVVVGSCSEEPRLQIDRISDRIETSLSGRYGSEVQVRSCPSDVTARRGGAFRCTVEVEGRSFRVKVTQRDDSGNVSVEPLAAVVRTERIAADLTAELQARFGRTFTVGCGDPVTEVVDPGTVLSCHVVDATEQRDVKVTVKDVSGSLAYDLGEPSSVTPAPPATSPPSGETPAPTNPP